MSQAQEKLEQMLGSPGELGFVRHLPEATAQRIVDATEQTINRHSTQLQEDIAQRVPQLPGWLRGVAASILS